jgi:hypothetical protein
MKSMAFTIIGVPAKDGTCHRTTILIDNGFTGFAIMSYLFAETLGYEFQHSNGESYRTMAGLMNTTLKVTITGVRLPDLSHHRTFTTTFEVASKESGNFGYKIIMGIGIMDELKIDQSQTDKIAEQ